MESLSAGTVILWLLAILGAWSFFKDCIPPAVRAVRRWQARNSVKAAQQQALNLVVWHDKLSELRDFKALSIYAIININIMLFLAVLSATLVGIGLFEPGQQEFASIGGLAIAMLAATFFQRTYFQMKALNNLDITTELVRARLLALAALYPEDNVLKPVQGHFDELYPRATNLPIEPSELKKLRRGFTF